MKKLNKLALVFTIIISLVFTLNLIPYNTDIWQAFANDSSFKTNQNEEVYLGGQTIGLNFEMGYVQIVGLCDAYTNEGLISPAKKSDLKIGDYIVKYNNISVNNINQLDYALCTYKENEGILDVIRKNEPLKIKITPAYDLITKKYKLGALVRDSISGIGTVTYIKKDDLKFGALGHPVQNENNELMKVSDNNIYKCSIVGAKKGIRGKAGELKGIFINDKIIGTSSNNLSTGIYGAFNNNVDVNSLESIKVGNISEAKIGKAEICSTVNGLKTERFSISIIKIDVRDKNNKNYVVKVTDDRLLELTGGIVQGMSGSPIIQDGKIIGAITHVFLNDSTKGYGISLNEMMKYN